MRRPVLIWLMVKRVEWKYGCMDGVVMSVQSCLAGAGFHNTLIMQAVKHDVPVLDLDVFRYFNDWFDRCLVAKLTGTWARLLKPPQA